jgi:outer membrane protein assembly factor BamB
MKYIKPRSWLLLTCLFIYGCSADKFDEKESITVLGENAELIVNQSLEDIPFAVPPAKSNKAWLNSERSTYGNIAVESLKHNERKRYGWDSTEFFHLNISPMVVDGKIFTVDGKGMVYALSEEKISKILWKNRAISKELETFVTSKGGFAYSKGMVYLTIGSNKIYALNSETGELIWQRTLSDITRSTPLVSKDKVYVVTINNQIYALNKRNGKISWLNSATPKIAGVFGSGSVSSGRKDIILVPYSSGELYAIDSQKGVLLWSDLLIKPSLDAADFIFTDIDADPIIDGNIVYSISYQGMLVANNLFSGARIWEREVASAQTPWLAGDYLYILTSDKHLVAIYKHDGRVLWNIDLVEGVKEKKARKIIFTGPIMINGEIALMASNGDLLFYDAQNGKEVNRKRIARRSYQMPIAANGKLYLLSKFSRLYQIN